MLRLNTLFRLLPSDKSTTRREIRLHGMTVGWAAHKTSSSINLNDLGPSQLSGPHIRLTLAVIYFVQLKLMTKERLLWEQLCIQKYKICVSLKNRFSVWEFKSSPPSSIACPSKHATYCLTRVFGKYT